MTKFEKQIREYHNNKMQYNYQFDKLSDELNLHKNNSFKINLKTYLIIIFAILFLIIDFFGGYFYCLSINQSKDVELNIEQIEEYTNCKINKIVYSETIENDSRLVFYLGVNNNDNSQVLIINLYTNTNKQVISIVVEGEEYIISSDMTKISEDNCKVIKMQNEESIDIEIKYVDSSNQTCSSYFKIFLK